MSPLLRSSGIGRLHGLRDGGRRAFRLHFGKGLARCGIDCLESECGGQVPHDHIAIAWIELDRVTPPADLLGGNERGAAAGEDNEHDAAALGSIENRIGDECDRLDRRVQGEVRVAVLAEAVDARVGPDIGPVPPVAIQLDVVDVWRAAGLDHENQLVLGAVERAHAAVGLGPDAEVFELTVNRLAGARDFAGVAPVHTNEVDRSLGAIFNKPAEYGLEELRKLGLSVL